MAAKLLDDDDRLRELPFLIVALMIHMALLSSPLLRRSTTAPRAEEPSVAVDFVAAVPAPPAPAAVEAAPAPLPPKPQPAERRAGRRVGSAGVKARAAKPAPKPLAKRGGPTAAQRQAALLRREKAAEIRAQNELARRRNEDAARAAARVLAERKAQAAAAARAEAARQEAARAQHRADASRALASLKDPDETLSDAVADHPAAASAAAGPAALDGGAAAPKAGADEALYDGDAAAAGGAARGSRQGALSWGLEGPAGDRRLLERPLPQSPAWLSKRGIDVFVQVKFQVQRDGRVRPGAVIKRTSGFPEVDRRALEALLRWRFASASGGGEPWGVATFRFLGS